MKENSTNNVNKKLIQQMCPVTYTLSKIGGRWKPIILYHLQGGSMRYGQLKRSMPAITEKMLIQSLKDLESESLISRKVTHVVPPQVSYALRSKGKTLIPILSAMSDWGKKNQK